MNHEELQRALIKVLGASGRQIKIIEMSICGTENPQEFDLRFIVKVGE